MADYVAMPRKSGASFLVGAISAPRVAAPRAENLYRRYRGAVTSTMPIRGVKESRTMAVDYEVGSRYVAATDPFRTDDAAIKIDATYQVNSFVSTDFSGLAKKYSNFGGTWDYSDMAAVVERLSMAVALQSFNDNVTTATMRGGRALDVTVLGMSDSPISASQTSVFIPRLVDHQISGDVFAVLVAAVNGAGSTVVTDVLNIDAATAAPLVPQCSGGELAAACVRALQMLGANYDAAGQGAIFAYALTRGLHKASTVVGHSDEGGYMRQVMRTGEFRAPYGGVHYGLQAYLGLPSMASTSRTAMAGWADSLALATAAAVAHCDPMTEFHGRFYPTTFTSKAQPIVTHGGGASQAAGDADALVIGQAIASDCGAFCSLYAGALSTLFGCAGGEDVVERHLRSCFSLAAERPDRHLRYAVVHPYFWVEPTTLLDQNAFGTLAEKSGLGALASVHVLRTMPLFERVHHVKDLGGRSTAVVDFTGARRCGLMVHLNGHAENGLGSASIRQADPTSFMSAGARAMGAGGVREAMAAGAPLSDYLWARGQSPLPAPGELINTDGTIGLLLSHFDWGAAGEAVYTHLPTADELGGCVTLRVTRPTGRDPGAANAGGRDAVRARSTAAVSLETARMRFRMCGTAVEDIDEMSFSTPRVARGAAGGLPASSEGASGHGASTGVTQERGESAAPQPAGALARGPRAPVVTQLDHQRGPHRESRPVAVHGGGGAELRPPGPRAAEPEPPGDAVAAPVPEATAG